MPTPQNLFRLLSEFIVLLLGALMIFIALFRRVGLPGRPATLELLGFILIYWGVRAWTRAAKSASVLQARIRAGSLMLVGLFVLSIPLLPLRHASLLLGSAGSVLVLRGLLGAILIARDFSTA